MKTKDTSNISVVNRKSRKALAGGLSGMLSALAFQPLDVIRTHQQGAFGSPEVSQKNTSVASALRHIFTSGNANGASKLRSLWRGTSPTLIRVGGGAALYFTTLESSLQYLPPSSVSTFVSGAFARTFAGAVMSPFTIVKARMEWQAPGTYKGNFHAFQMVLRAEGVRGLYRGMLPTLVRDVPFSGLYVLMYKRLKAGLEEKKIANIPSYVINFSSGVIAGVLATTLVHPADVVKTRMQLGIVKSYDDRLLVKNPMSLRQTVRKIAMEEGWRGFTKGIVPRVIKRTLSTALTWTIYEHLSVSSS